MAHRRKDRMNGNRRRLYPTFQTRAGQVIPPEDVLDHAVPIFNGHNRDWAGLEVTQLRRGDEIDFYTGKAYKI